MEMVKCKVKSCENNKNAGQGFCKTHYMRMWRGQPLDMVSRRTPRPAIIEGDIAKIPLGVNAKDGYAIVDKEYAWIDKYKWSKAIRNAVVRERGDKLHHLIMGKPPEGMVVDHINRDTTDNRKANLRFCTQAQNAQNISPQKNNTSGYRGVHWHGGKWQTEIKVNYKRIRLGRYTDIIEAAKAYNRAAKKYFGEFAVLNDTGTPND